jgi:hypothetical protein
MVVLQIMAKGFSKGKRGNRVWRLNYFLGQGLRKAFVQRREKMKTKAMFWTIVLLLSAFTGSVFGATEGDFNNFFGGNAGANFAGGGL